MQQRTPAGFKPCSTSIQQIRCSVDRLNASCEASTVGQPIPSQHSYSVRLEGWRRLPFKGEVPSMVRTLLGRGERRIVLDLAGIARIDAAGIGELVRAYNIATAGNGALRIANTNPWVREMLERVGLFDRLNAGANDTQDPDRAEDRDVSGALDNRSVSLRFGRRVNC
jgi:anti-anti-sigma factor